MKRIHKVATLPIETLRGYKEARRSIMSNNRVKEIVRENNFGYILGGSAIGIGAVVALASPLAGAPQNALEFGGLVAAFGAAVFVVSSIWNTLSLRRALAEQEAAANLKDAVTDFRADVDAIYDCMREQKEALRREDEALNRHIEDQVRNLWDENNRIHERINHIEYNQESKSKSK